MWTKPNCCRSLLESNVLILERDCDVRQRVLDAVIARSNHLYLGLDISTQSTGYAVLAPAAVTPVSCSSGEEALLREAAKADLVEWGCIAGSGTGSKKKDVVDVGVIIEQRIKEMSSRCGGAGRGANSRGFGLDEGSGDYDIFSAESCILQCVVEVCHRHRIRICAKSTLCAMYAKSPRQGGISYGVWQRQYT